MTKYFVSMTGSDSDAGTNDAPWATVQHGVDYLILNGNPGNHLILKSSNTSPYVGRYKEKVNIAGLDGNSTNYYEIHPQSGGTIVISGATLAGNYYGLIGCRANDSCSYIHISGLNLYHAGLNGTGDYAFLFNGYLNPGTIEHIIIDYCEISSATASAIHVYGDDYPLTNAKYIEFANNTIWNVNDKASASNEAISFINTWWFNIHHNTVKNFGKEGIDVKSGCKSGSVHHNYVDNSRPSPLLNWNYSHVGIYCDGMTRINRNITISSNYVTGYGGEGIRIGAEEIQGHVRDILVCDNVVDLSYVSGYLQNRTFSSPTDNDEGQAWSSVRIINNTFYSRLGNNNSPLIHQQAHHLSGNVIANNIFAGHETYINFNFNHMNFSDLTNNRLVFTDNLFYRFGGTAYISWNGTRYSDAVANEAKWGTNPILRTDPGFTNVDINDMHLLSTSPAISGGITSVVCPGVTYTQQTLDYDNATRGSYNDVGAYEYVAVAGNQPPVASFTWLPTNPTEGATVTFNASESYDNDGYIATYEWDWDGDGVYEDSTENTSITHTFTAVGEYTVVLKVTDNESESTTATNIISVSYISPTPDELWYNNSWNYRKKITINSSYISGNHTNIPILVKFDGDSDLSSHALKNGTDVIFVESSNTSRIKHEIDTYVNGTGTFWVRIPTLWDSGYITDYKVYMYYGNSTGGDQTALHGYKPSSVWDDNYVFICHMNDTTNNKTLKDSSRWNNPTNKYTANSPTMIKSIMGSSQKFKDTDASYISSNKITAYYVTAQATISAWVSGVTTMDDFGYIFCRGYQGTTTTKPFTLYIQNGATPAAGEVQALYYNISTNKTRYINSNWIYYGDLAYLTIYFNSGVSSGFYYNTSDLFTTAGLGNLASGAYGVMIGNRGDRTRAFSGSIDEVRYSRKYRTKGQHITEYNNVVYYNDFCTVASEETQAEITTTIYQMQIAGNTTCKITGTGNMRVS